MSEIQWRLVWLSSLSGVLYAGLTVFSIIHGQEGRVALLILVGLGLAMALGARAKPVRHAFLAGFLSGLVAIWTQAALLPLYFDYNPSYRSIEIPFGLSPRVYTVLFAPLGALAAGLLAAFVSWPIARFIRPERKPSV